MLLVVSNMAPVPRHGYHIHAPKQGMWRELLNTDATYYGGSNIGNGGEVFAYPSFHEAELSLVLPPLATVVLAPCANG